MLLSGTSGRNAIPTHGGFNFSEYNIQDHKPGPSNGADFSEQERIHKEWAGRNPLNPPKSTSDKSSGFGLNKAYGWRENTLSGVPAAQSSSVERTSGLQATFRGASGESLFGRALRHGHGQNDPALQHMLYQSQIAPAVQSNDRLDPDSYYHSDVGVPSVISQNLLEHATQNAFQEGLKVRRTGKHHHQHLDVERRPFMINTSNSGTGTHHTQAMPHFPVVSGFRADRPLMLSDLPAPPAPNIIPQSGPGPLEQTSNRGVYLFA
jgi:hypothetical protein